MRVDLEKITKNFARVEVLQEINLDVKEGEFVAFLGPSGCGKTTTLLIIAGIYKPTSGYVKFDGKIVNKVVPKNRNIGMVFQSYALYSHMNVYENLSFALKLQKRPRDEMRREAKRVADMMGIGELLERKVGMLSGGQQQRVALGRALIKKPQLLLFDEPLSNLDARLRIHMRSEIKKLQHDLGITSIYVTHDQIEAMSMADRIAVMKDGVLQAYETADDLHNKPKTMFIAGFVGNPPMNIIDCELRKKDGRLYALLGEGVELLVPKAREPENIPPRVKMGIRPQDLSIEKNEGVPFNVFLVEPTGREDTIICTKGNVYLSTVADPIRGTKEGEDVKLFFNMEKVQFFDTDKEKSILWM